ncbi:MAG: TetR/AcrR family transcriptional regulator [Myxococcota bacterium]
MGRPRTSREEMLAGAARALAADRNASMATIAAAIGVSRATLHRHYATRRELLVELTRRALDETDRLCAVRMAGARDTRHALELMVEALVVIGERYPFLTYAMEVMTDEGVRAHYARQVAELAELVELAKRDGVIREGVPTAWVARSLDALLYAGWEAVRAGEVPKEEVATLLVRTLLEGVAPRGG